MHSEAEFLFWENNFLFMINNKNLDKRVINKKKTYMYNTQEHTVLLKDRSGPYLIFRNTGSFFCFNGSLSNWYNNVIIDEIYKSRENSLACERVYRIFIFML
jgi:hypothetical protein